eukprot:GEMP01014701.1.p1 GENE.GEMP01014701.1~~GEMP01014701.1.p1  ORF type:complete len:651 (+),score=132.10 GEMP01014701.1:190-2142(+)
MAWEGLGHFRGLFEDARVVVRAIPSPEMELLQMTEPVEWRIDGEQVHYEIFDDGVVHLKITPNLTEEEQAALDAAAASQHPSQPSHPRETYEDPQVDVAAAAASPSARRTTRARRAAPKRQRTYRAATMTRRTAPGGVTRLPAAALADGNRSTQSAHRGAMRSLAAAPADDDRTARSAQRGAMRSLAAAPADDDRTARSAQRAAKRSPAATPAGDNRSTQSAQRGTKGSSVAAAPADEDRSAQSAHRGATRSPATAPADDNRSASSAQREATRSPATAPAEDNRLALSVHRGTKRTLMPSSGQEYTIIGALRSTARMGKRPLPVNWGAEENSVPNTPKSAGLTAAKRPQRSRALAIRRPTVSPADKNEAPSPREHTTADMVDNMNSAANSFSQPSGTDAHGSTHPKDTAPPNQRGNYRPPKMPHDDDFPEHHLVKIGHCDGKLFDKTVTLDVTETMHPKEFLKKYDVPTVPDCDDDDDDVSAYDAKRGSMAGHGRGRSNSGDSGQMTSRYGRRSRSGGSRHSRSCNSPVGRLGVSRRSTSADSHRSISDNSRRSMSRGRRNSLSRDRPDSEHGSMSQGKDGKDAAGSRDARRTGGSIEKEPYIQHDGRRGRSDRSASSWSRTSSRSYSRSLSIFDEGEQVHQREDGGHAG